MKMKNKILLRIIWTLGLIFPCIYSYADTQYKEYWSGGTKHHQYAFFYGSILNQGTDNAVPTNGKDKYGNDLGFYCTYDSPYSASVSDGLIHWKVRDMNPNGTKGTDDVASEDTTEEVALYKVPHRFVSDNYWFYIEDDGTGGVNYNIEDPALTTDKACIKIATDSETTRKKARTFIIYRVTRNIPLQSNVASLCTIWQASKADIDIESRTVKVYLDGDYVGQQDGTVYFPERTMDDSDLSVAPVSGVFLDTTKGGGDGIDRDGKTYIVYLATQYTVVYNSNGGSGSVPNQTFKYNVAQNLNNGSALSRTGYAYNGWNTKADGTGTSYSAGQNVTNLTKDKNGKITLYAQWAPNTYTVNFNSNGGSGSMNSQTFTYDVAQNLNTNVFTKSGYGFSKWNTQADGKGTDYTDKQSVSNLTSTQDGVVTLYAQWANLYKYSLVYDANGGSGAPATQNTDWLTESTHTFTISSEVPTKTGYKFLGWYDAKTGGNKLEGTVTVTGTSGSTVTKTLYAQWEEGESDMTISITNLQTNEYVLFKAVGLTGKGKDKEYTVALSSAKTSVALKELPIGSYRVTALYWSQSEDVTSVVNPTTVTEDHDITGGYEFKFIASQKSNPLPHAEASVNNVWVKEK